MGELFYQVAISGNSGRINAAEKFHSHQLKAWHSEKRIVLVLAGTQSGKTSFGPAWLTREIVLRGAGTYIIGVPDFRIADKNVIPYLEYLWRVNGKFALMRYNKVKHVFTMTSLGEYIFFGSKQSKSTRVFIGSAVNPESLESATAKGVWLDECGQRKFSYSAYDALVRRVALNMGRILMTTTPYEHNWLKQEIHDKAVRGDDSIDMIRFRSLDNPTFPADEYHRLKSTMQAWRFDMFYNAIFTKPAGSIYDCFDSDNHIIEPFEIPAKWAKFAGVDFGGVNTVGVYIAVDKDNQKVYVYDEYSQGNLLGSQHAKRLKSSGIDFAVGGAKSEEQWRNEFRSGGLKVFQPLVSDVELGIDYVYNAIQNDKLFIFRSASQTINQLLDYSRELDTMGEPTSTIKNKSDYHYLDALRYAVPHCVRTDKRGNTLVGLPSGSKVTVVMWDGRL